MKRKNLILTVILIGLFAVGCSDKSQPSPESNSAPDTIPAETEELAYPPPVYTFETQSAYPVGEITSEYPQGPEFTIFTPLTESDQVVRGSGPAGVPIKLISVSEVGVVLSETVIDEDGTFTFTLREPLVSGHIVGIQLGDLGGTDLNADDFLYSPTYYERPFIGIMFDMVPVD